MRTHSLDAFFQAALMVGFGIASVRLVYTAYMPGRVPIRVFRAVGAVLTLSWSGFYAVAVVGDVPIAIMADFSRGLQYVNLLMFLAWGFLWTETRWIKEARQRLAELEIDNGV